MSGPGWYPDPWQPGGWRWHDGTQWTSWTGPPPVPPGMARAPLAPTPPTAADLAAEERARPWAELSVVGLALATALGSIAMAMAFRDLFEPLFDLFRAGDPSQAEIDAAVEEITARQDEYWWLNLAGFVPLAFLAGMAVWSHRIANVAARLGYPARRSPGWAAGGWFVPLVNLWFPYQGIADSLAPGNGARPTVLWWWLLYVLAGVASLVAMAVGVFSEVNLAVVAAVPCALAAVEAVVGLRVVAAVHEDHARAVGR